MRDYSNLNLVPESQFDVASDSDLIALLRHIQNEYDDLRAIERRINDIRRKREEEKLGQFDVEKAERVLAARQGISVETLRNKLKNESL